MYSTFSFRLHHRGYETPTNACLTDLLLHASSCPFQMGFSLCLFNSDSRLMGSLSFFQKIFPLVPNDLVFSFYIQGYKLLLAIYVVKGNETNKHVVSSGLKDRISAALNSMFPLCFNSSNAAPCPGWTMSWSWWPLACNGSNKSETK